MALRTQQVFDEDDDEDLKALRLAALQTLKCKPSSPSKQAPVPVFNHQNDAPTLPSVSRRLRNDFTRGGMNRGRHRNAAFQRHRVNSNLIAIVPMREPSPPSGASDPSTAKSAKPSLAIDSASPKLVLPQDRYFKTEEVSEEKHPEVSTKFDRFEHSSSESSAEESAEEEDEGEAAPTGSAALSDVEADADVLLVKDEDDDDSLEKLMNEMEEELATDAVPQPAPAPAPVDPKRTFRRRSRHRRKGQPTPQAPPPKEKQPSPDSCSTGLQPHAQPSSPERVPRAAPPPERSPPPWRPPRSRSPSLSPGRAPARSRRSRSLSMSPPPPRLKVYSPARPGGGRRSFSRSRSPRSPRRLRSRSPLPFRSSRSPPVRPRKYSPGRSPTRRHAASPHPRRLSPRRLSPPRWVSPRRQSVSPKFRRQSASPGARGPRRSASPPLAPVRRPSPISYRRRSPSPARRNQSPPPRRYSPPRRNPSPPRRRASRSPSPRRRRLSPSGSGRKTSPWTPIRTSGGGRLSPAGRRSPLDTANSYKRKSPTLSPGYGRHRRSDSPARRGGLADDKNAYRAPSPVRGRRPLQESRFNNIRRSCSPPCDGPRRGASPAPSPQRAPPVSPSDKNWSCTSSLSLSPSPERTGGEGPRRVRSPLRVRKRTEFPPYAETTGARAQPSAAPSANPSTIDDPSRKTAKRRKERSKSKKRARTRGGDDVSRTRDRAEAPAADVPAPEVENGLASHRADTNPVLEARRRKFESAVPIESSNKKIRLRKEPEGSREENRKRSQPPETLPHTEDLEELLDLELENAVDLWAEDDSESEGDMKSLPTHKLKTKSQPPSAAPILAPAAAPTSAQSMARQESKLQDVFLDAVDIRGDVKHGKGPAPPPSPPSPPRRNTASRNNNNETYSILSAILNIRCVPLYKLQGGDIKPVKQEEKAKINSGHGNEREHGSQLKQREGSHKDSGNNRVVDRINVKDSSVENEKESVSVPDKVDFEKRAKMDVVNADDDLLENSTGKDCDLRAELSRRRAERLTMAGSVHETLPTRLVQSAFKDVVGKKNFRKLDRERHGISKRSENTKGADNGDGRRVLVLKSAAAEQRVPSISVTFPKEEKHKRGESPVTGAKLPIHMRLGLPGGGGGFPEDRERQGSGRRRGSRKVKLKRSVLLASPAGEKVMCGSSLSLTLGSMRHSLLCSLPTFPSPICGLRGIWSHFRAQLGQARKLFNIAVATRHTNNQDMTECEISIQGKAWGESLFVFFLFQYLSYVVSLPFILNIILPPVFSSKTNLQIQTYIVSIQA